MTIKLPNRQIKKGSSTEPKARLLRARKPAHLRAFSPVPGVQRCPPHCPPQPGPFLREPGPLHGELSLALGRPLNIRAVAELIGCSPWTVRQKLLPEGLPYFRSGASGKLIFYRDQVIRWIETKQKGG